MLIENRLVADLIFSPAGEAMQKRVWNEVLDILSTKSPEVKAIALSA